jgi:MEDS: MEthanogen/methylotroph, DcmR Sensory domain
MATHRHQCLIYEGSPSQHLPALAATRRQKLDDNYRCLYLNSPVMVAGLRSSLASQGLDVFHHTSKGSLVLSSERHHLLDGCFDVDRMLADLDDAVESSLKEGYKALWATGDISWEFGPQKDFSKLLEYEKRLEEFLQRHPAFSGICQYHAGTLPREALRQGLLAHPSIFIKRNTIAHQSSLSSRDKYRVGVRCELTLATAMNQPLSKPTFPLFRDQSQICEARN